ncbi:VacB/RNase II family 3'-5' exoribonuclease [Sphingomonas sp. LY160]|uniref:ribonuclease R family protein n=1 Tax=Sphingomonas sp. LY160 TaxID=3095342 RepID=UPI002ADED64E|nr:VacB/RNase II family 3'-5' exoribonuclease [Sphingomonas sp. LY160]MEA1073204.1 VacB/RNase II family 3'-5' exoribonuclease [Sphingomonas sp. LY160]
MPRKSAPGLPTPKQILEFIEQSGQPAGKREIARAFGLHGHDKIMLKALLKDMADEGLIDSAPGRAFHKSGGIPRVTVLRVVSVDDGQVLATPESWHADTPAPRLRVIERGRRSALTLNDRILARTEEAGNGHVAHVMKKLEKSADLVLGVVRKEGDRHFLTPVDKRERRELMIADLKDAQPGDLVLAEPSGRPPRVTARIDAILGDPFAPRSFSMIAIHKHGLRDEFRPEAIEEATRAASLPIGDDREDLTHLPIVAIDPEDARDHDDAIWAAAREDGDGWDAIVAIADVSFYVRPGSELDREARARGNSIYFPDGVIPMLPHELSSGICSLKEGEVRAALVCHLHVAKDGGLKAWRFTRAKIIVASNIAYEDAQAAYDAAIEDKVDVSSSPCSMPAPDGPVDAELVETALKPLWACWRALLSAREKREPLDLDLPERRVVLDEKGRILSVAPRERLDAHRLVEDYMIAANVAAAKALEHKKAPVMYRIHEAPGREKLVALKEYLATFDIEFALGQVIKPGTFNRVLERIGPEHDARSQIMEQVLRTQMQARYGPEPLGHFGLSLGSYAHFTSPIRRYADLLVHRALVASYRLGEGGLPPADAEDFSRIGEQISMLERRAMEAERDTVDRYVAAFLADRVGQILRCRITGVQPFGFFATVTDLGGDGLVPAAILGNEYFRYDEAARALVGVDSGETFRVGQHIDLRLADANPASGALRFELPEGKFAAPPCSSPRKDRVRVSPKRGRPANIRHQGKRR